MPGISSSNIDPAHLEQLREWFISEWGEVDPFQNPGNEYAIPSPIVASEDKKLLGGLSFTIAPKPMSADAGIWINAVLVAPEHRGLGIASKLVQAAESEARLSGQNELYVYSEYPELYVKLGWHVEKDDGKSSVLKKVLINE